MVNEYRKQKMYDALRGQVSVRLIRVMDVADVDIVNLSGGGLPAMRWFTGDARIAQQSSN